jgi:hypothetical protein
MAALKGGTLCFTHSPKAARQRTAARRKGGHATRTPKAAGPAPVATVADLQGHLGRVLADVLVRENTERRANAAARLIVVAARLIEQGEYEERLEMIEQRLTAMENGG